MEDGRTRTLRPIQTRSATSEAYVVLRDAILRGTFPPNTRLVEETLAEELHSSRTPVREALIMLERDGLVQSGRRGVFVRSFSHQELRDMYEIRSVLEGYGAEVAVEYATPADAALLQKMCDEVEARVARGFEHDAERTLWLVEQNRLYHRAILNLVPNKQLGDLVATSFELPMVYRAAFWHAPEFPRALHYHRTIAKAFAARDAGRAGRVMREHIVESMDMLLAYLVEPQGEQLVELMELMEPWITRQDNTAQESV